MNKQKQNKVNQPTMGRPGGGHGAHLTKPKEKAKDVKGTFKKLWAYLKKQEKGLLLVIVLVLITTALNIAGPYLLKFAIDTYIIGEINFPSLVKVLFAMALIYFTAAGLTLLQQWIMIAVSQRAIKSLREDIFHKFQTLTIRFLIHEPLVN